MKHCVKVGEPQDFAVWKVAWPLDRAPNFSDLQKPEKANLLAQLIAEQSAVCCYCGASIATSISHVEHFRPQATYKHLELQYENLFASCLRSVEADAPLHCGFAKGDKFDENLCICPTDDGCEERFTYGLDGRARPLDEADAQAKYMIGILELNSPPLFQARASLLTSLFDPKFLESASNADLLSLAESFRTPDDAGMLPNLGHVAALFAERLA